MGGERKCLTFRTGVSYNLDMSRSVTIRLPDADFAELEASCAKQGLTVSDALKEAVRRWLGREVDPAPEPITKKVRLPPVIRASAMLKDPEAAKSERYAIQFGPTPKTGSFFKKSKEKP